MRAVARVGGLVEFVRKPIAVAVLERDCSRNGPHDLDLGQVFSLFHAPILPQHRNSSMDS